MRTTMLHTGLLILLVGCAPSAYQRFYQSDLAGASLEGGGLHLNDGNPDLVVGTSREADDARMLEDGFLMIGHVFFEGSEESDRAVRRVGREHGAAVAIVYKRYAGTDTQVLRVHHLNTRNHVGPPSHSVRASTEMYEQGATFWAKAKVPPVFGAFEAVPDPDRQVELNSSEGAAVKAVVKDSPASLCGLRRGDVLARMGGQPAVAGGLAALAERFRGQAVEVEVLRDGAKQTVTCQLEKGNGDARGQPSSGSP